ncbi:MAG: GtrA family protein [Marinibacterium sp.]|nr:GtrA family protein [Marinibacterium sp.]
MSLDQLVLRYAAFAVVATLANLAVQRLCLRLYDGAYGVMIAIFVGTVVGLVIKYLLDKRWIFADQRSGLATHGRLFGLYTAMGVITTVIFWGTEYTFWQIWQTQPMRELGAVLGLAVGYVTKYNLDKRFVFAPQALEPAA